MPKNHGVYAHDKFFRTAMSNKRVAREFLEAHMPKNILKEVDLNSLLLQPRSYIDDVRSETTVDVLFKTHISNKESYIYLLLEHQSEPDELMPFRMLKYTCNIIDQHLRVTKKKSIPLIYSMVIYHAKRPYPYATNINEMVDASKELVDQYFLKPFHLVDLARIEDEELKEHTWAGVMEFALKHIFARDILPYLQDFAYLLRNIDQSGGRDYISLVLQYILERAELGNKQAFFDLINKDISVEVGSKVMTIAEQLRIEGKLEGKLEGKRESQIEIAKRLLAERVELAFVVKITGLSLDQIIALKQ